VPMEIFHKLAEFFNDAAGVAALDRSMTQDPAVESLPDVAILL